MAYQGYRHKSDKTVGANEAVEPVKSGSENKTPAPLKTATGGNPGTNRYSGPSSVNPGERGAPAAANGLARVDAVLDNVIRGAEAGGDSWQTRKLSGGNVPLHDAMRPANAGGSPSGTVPTKCGGSPFNDEQQRRVATLKAGR